LGIRGLRRKKKPLCGLFSRYLSQNRNTNFSNLIYEDIQNEVRYELPSSVTFDVAVQEDDFEGMQTYYLNRTENNDSVILYLHGGAYVNQPADLQWELCNSLASNINAEVIVQFIRWHRFIPGTRPVYFYQNCIKI